MRKPMMTKRLNKLTVYTLTIAMLGCAVYTQAGNWDELIWPLCGRLGEDPTSWSWTDGDPCPATVLNNPGSYSDEPIHHGYGFRTMNDTSAPVSFHRGLDFATFAATASAGLDGNPVFAVADGKVKDVDGSGTDRTMTILHPANSSLDTITWCTSSNKCIATVYSHIQDVQVAETNIVSRGDHIAYTGESADNSFEHLHFEVRWPQMRKSNDSGKWTYAKDAVNPMRFLPYSPATGTIDLSVVEGGLTAYDNDVLATVTVSANTGYMMDFESVTLIAYELDSSVSPAQWVVNEKDANLLAAFSTINSLSEDGYYLDDDYLVADGSYDYSVHNPETLNRHYSPFPSGSSKWTNDEYDITYYREKWSGTHISLDGLVEINASGDFTTQDGHRYHAFDFKVVTASPNQDGDDHRYWELTVGFLGYDIPTGATPMCYVAVATMLDTSATDRTVVATAHSDSNHACASYNIEAVSGIFNGLD